MGMVEKISMTPGTEEKADPKLVLGLQRFLYGAKAPHGDMIDRLDFARRLAWGGWDRETSGSLERALDPDDMYWLGTLTRTHLEEHLRGTRILFYQGNRSATTFLAGIDIDAHDGQADAWDAARWIHDTFFPSSYAEPSTNGAGVHLYVLLRTQERRRGPYLTKKKVNDMLAQASAELKAIIADEGFEATCDGFCATFNEIKKVHGRQHITRRGSCIRLPRPSDMKQLEALSMIKPYYTSALNAIAAEFQDRGLQATQQEGDPHARDTNKPSLLNSYKLSNARLADVAVNAEQEEVGLRGGKERRGGVLSGGGCGGAFDGMLRLGLGMTWAAGRVVGAGELVGEYQRRGLHTGMGRQDVRRRAKRAGLVVGWIRKGYDASKRGAGGRGLDFNDFLWVRDAVTPEAVATMRGERLFGYGSVIGWKDVATVVWLAENPVLNAVRHDFTLGLNLVQAFSERLVEAGLLDCAVYNTKGTACRRIAERRGWIMELARERQGESRRYVLSLMHPRAAVWWFRYGQAVERVKRREKVRSLVENGLRPTMQALGTSA